MKRLLFVLALSALVAAPGVGAAGAATAGNITTVDTVTEFEFVPGGSLTLNQRFEPAEITVGSGDLVRFMPDIKEPEESHTATVAEPAKIPDTIEEAFACFAPGGACAVAELHFANEEPRFAINRGERGFDAPGDSRLLLEGNPQTVRVTAPAGSTLEYLCAFHPWMQAEIHVSH
jgi:plastocyanin